MARRTTRQRYEIPASPGDMGSAGCDRSEYCDDCGGQGGSRPFRIARGADGRVQVHRNDELERHEYGEKPYGAVNPWAVCHASVGPKKSAAFERCVMDVKAKHKIKRNHYKKAKIAFYPESEHFRIVHS